MIILKKICFFFGGELPCNAGFQFCFAIYSTIPTKSFGDQIVKIYKRYGSYQADSSSHLFYPLDGILKHKNAIFDTIISVD